MSSEDQQEPPEYFEDLPPWLQRTLVQLLRYPESWITEPYATPEWITNWRQASWAGWAAPASLAPFYATTMVTTAMRAGWIPQGMPEYTYATRQTMALQTAADYNLYGSQYGKMQTNLWQARAAYWGAQQQWAPIAEAWGAARLASFVFPEFGMIRAFGFPFYGAAQRLTTAAAMAPYVREAMQYPGALERIQRSSTFWAGQYGQPGAPFGEALTAQLISGFGEWTAAQTLLWGLRPGAGLLSTLKATAFISWTQAGLGLIADPLATLAVKQMWGIPTSPQERFEIGVQIGIGAGMIGAGILAGTRWGFLPTIQATRAVTGAYGLSQIAAVTEAMKLAGYTRVTYDIAALPSVLGYAQIPPRTVQSMFAGLRTETQGLILEQMYKYGGTLKWYVSGLGGVFPETQFNVPEIFGATRKVPLGAFGPYRPMAPTGYDDGRVWITGYTGLSRFALLSRMLGSVVGGQVGFEAMGGLATAYIEEAARRRGWTPEQKQLGLAIGVPLAGTAGVLFGSWLGALAASATGLGLPMAATYGTYAILSALTEPTAAVRQYQTPMQARYALGPSAFTWTIPTGEQIRTGLMQPYEDYRALMGQPRVAHHFDIYAQPVGAALPPAAIEPGVPYNAAIQSWQYLAYGGNQFGRTQVGLQQAEAFRYSRAETGGINQAYWNRQGGVSFYFTGTSIAEQQARAYPWYGGRYGAEDYTTTYVWQSGQLVPRGWTPQQWAQAAYGYSRQETAMSPYAQIFQPQYETRLKTLAEAQSYQLYLSGASSLWLAQNTFRITGVEGAYNVLLVRDIGTLGSESLANYARSRVYGQTRAEDVGLAIKYLDTQLALGKINEVDYAHALINLQSQAARAAEGGYALYGGGAPLPSQAGYASVYGTENLPSGWVFGTDVSASINAMIYTMGFTDTMILEALTEHYSGNEALASYMFHTHGGRGRPTGFSGKGKRLRALKILYGEDWKAHWPKPRPSSEFVRMMGIGQPVTMPWGEVVTPPIPPHDAPLYLGTYALREAVWWTKQWIAYYVEYRTAPPPGWTPGGGGARWPWTGPRLQIEYQRWGYEAYGYEEAEGVSKGLVQQWIYEAISDFASTGIIMPGPMSWDDEMTDAVTRRISPSLSTSLYDDGNR